jgi:hypothetical protein
MNNYLAFHLANKNRVGVGMGHMQPRTSIQHIMEATEKMANLKNYVCEFVEHYDTHNAIFGLNEKMQPVELTSGFFEVTGVYKTLESAMDGLQLGESIQILGLESDRHYRTGIVHQTITECAEDALIVNIMTLEQLEEKNPMVMEGGAAGHMAHIMDYSDMTCNDICDLVSDMFGGKITDITEKIDGMNIQASVNNAGEVIFIRNKGDINSERGGMTLGDMISRWADKDHVRNTMTSAGEVVQQVLSKVGKSFFNPDEKTRLFVNCEAVVSGKTNILPYASSQVDFHDIHVYKLSDANGWEKTEVTKKGLNKIQAACEGIDSAHITPEIVIKVTEKSAQKKDQYIKAFQKLWDDAGLDYRTSIDDYKYERFEKYMKKNHPWVLDEFDGRRYLYERLINGSKVVNIRALRKFYPGHETELSSMENQKGELMDIRYYVVKHLDETFIKFGNDIIKLCDGFINKADSSAVDVLLADLKDALKAAEKIGDDTLNHKVAIQMQRLCGGNIEAAELNNSEGIVFNYKGRMMKVTGSFAPLNAIMGTRFIS